MPLPGTDESVRAQCRPAVDTHIRHIGKHPKGIWAPECGYRPAGFWNYPVDNADGSPTAPGFNRIGVEQVLSESNIDFFVVDTHLIEESELSERTNGHQTGQQKSAPQPSLYQPYYVGPNRAAEATPVLPRRPRTCVQVWPGDIGYPGDDAYLDFHKKRWPGGHRYWRVTGPRADLADKQPYYPEIAAQRTRDHAEHFVSIVCDALRAGFEDEIPLILSAPFDAELFGHWWFEGPLWLEHVARIFAREEVPVKLTDCTRYIDQYPPQDFLA